MFSLPAGIPLKRGLDISTTDFPAVFKELRDKKFSGYVAICVRAAETEEGTVLFDEGKIVGCAYEYYKLDKTIEGAEAFKRVLNATAAKNGIIDVFRLKPEQIQLALVVNEKMVFVPVEREWQNFKPRAFSEELEKEMKGVETQSAKTSTDILKKYKIGQFSAGNAGMESD